MIQGTEKFQGLWYIFAIHFRTLFSQSFNRFIWSSISDILSESISPSEYSLSTLSKGSLKVLYTLVSWWSYNHCCGWSVNFALLWQILNAYGAHRKLPELFLSRIWKFLGISQCCIWLETDSRIVYILKCQLDMNNASPKAITAYHLHQ